MGFAGLYGYLDAICERLGHILAALDLLNAQIETMNELLLRLAKEQQDEKKA